MKNSVSPTNALEVLKTEGERCVLVDVRSASEFNTLHAAPAMHFPLEQITDPSSIDRLKNKKILCICQSGSRGTKAVEALIAKGLTEVSNVEGGTTAWNNAQLPVVAGSKSVSIERQVRIAAGTLVVVGSLLGVAVSPYLLAIPLFVGSGLLFSGLTDTCGMAIVLARCPWNSR